MIKKYEIRDIDLDYKPILKVNILTFNLWRKIEHKMNSCTTKLEFIKCTSIIEILPPFLTSTGLPGP